MNARLIRRTGNAERKGQIVSGAFRGFNISCLDVALVFNYCIRHYQCLDYFVYPYDRFARPMIYKAIEHNHLGY